MTVWVLQKGSGAIVAAYADCDDAVNAAKKLNAEEKCGVEVWCLRVKGVKHES